MLLNSAVFLPVEPLDHAQGDPNNEAMHRRAAKRVKNWRNDRRLNQIAFAKLAKISVGTLQGFETATRATREKNLTKIARALGISLAELLNDDEPIATPNPLLAGLRDMDLQHAQHFHHTTPHAKSAAYDWLGPDVADDLRERIALLLERLLRMDRDLFETVERFMLNLKAIDDKSLSKKQTS